MTETSGSAWQHKSCVRSFFATHQRTLAHPIQRYRELDDTACPWLFLLTTCLGFFGAVALGLALVWWTLPLGVDGHAPFASLLSGNEIGANSVREAIEDLFGASLIAASLFLPGMVLAALCAPLAMRARLMFAVVMPHPSAWLLAPVITLLAAAPVVCATRYIWPAKQSSAGGEVLLLALGLAFVVANLGLAGSSIAGAVVLRRRSESER